MGGETSRPPPEGARDAPHDDLTTDPSAVERLLDACMAGDGPEASHRILDAEAITLLLWRCRSDPRFVAGLTQWLARHVDVKATFDGIELCVRVRCRCRCAPLSTRNNRATVRALSRE